MSRLTVATLVAAALGVGLGGDAPAKSAPIEYSGGHADIGVALENGDEFFLHYHFGADAVLDGTTLGGDEEYEPGEVYVRVSDSNLYDVNPIYDVGFGLGGSTIWNLPQSNTDAFANGAPFLGLATEELESTFGPVDFMLTGMTGPGQFSLYQHGFNSIPGGFAANAYWNSSDGFDGTDLLTMGAGGHDHYNWGFTAAGVYRLSITATSVNDPSLTDSGVFTFAVGDTTEVPEPTSLALFGAGGLILLVGGKLRRRKAKSA